VILLDAGAVRAFWNGHLALTRMIDNANAAGVGVLIPALCLLEAEQGRPYAGRAILAQPCVQVADLTAPDAIAAASILAAHPGLTAGMAASIAAAAPTAHRLAAHIIVTDHDQLYPPGIVAINIDHPGLK
jgi:hypothetical protein